VYFEPHSLLLTLPYRRQPFCVASQQQLLLKAVALTPLSAYALPEGVAQVSQYSVCPAAGLPMIFAACNEKHAIKNNSQ